MIEGLIGIVFLLLALWQFYAFYNAFRTVQKKGNEATSAFASLGIWYGFLFGVFFLISGIYFLIG
ncbi:immunity protein [Loigolactobacillus jiayinensis]|uniref:Immunity protein n=1 Tax=Loigolactobacillus jiayinensis TaxID=2486016 RepID=A0ABW1RBE1_9LACO|nr:immunity protein [Loigolactobacillus jiayinensis]